MFGDVAASARRTWGSAPPAGCPRSSSPGPRSAFSTEPLPEPLRPVMTTSSAVADAPFAPPAGVSLRRRISAVQAFDQVEVAVAAADQHRNAVRLGVAVHQVVAVLFHLEHGLVERHGLALLVVVDPEDLGLAARRSGSPAFRLAASTRGRLGFGSPPSGLRGARLVSRHLVRDLQGLLLQLLYGGRVNRREQVGAGADAHQLVVVIVAP